MAEKICIRCDKKKELKMFYKHSQMADGHLNVCIECVKSRTKKRESTLRDTDPDFVLKERKRGREKYYRLYGYRPTSKANKKAINTKYEGTYPEKVKAKIASQYIKAPAGHHGHHWSYNKQHYLDVIFLPIALHYKAHRFMRYSQEHKMYFTINGTLLDTREKHEQYIQSIKNLQ